MNLLRENSPQEPILLKKPFSEDPVEQKRQETEI